ncbi:MAG: endolytic transglycosylase MltG [Ruminococcus sp.]|nr:endolytic transglycosylase MltG [Ruminococcus sp.]
MSDNRDAINDILNELDKKNEQASPDNVHSESNSAHVQENLQINSQHEPVHENVVSSSNNDNRPIYTQSQNMAGYPNNGIPQRMYSNPTQHKKKHKKKKKQINRLPGVIIYTTFIFGISIILSLVIISFGKDMLGIGKSDKTQLVVIPDGATTQEISVLLETEGIIKSPKAFQFFTKLRKDKSYYIAGQHFLRPNMAYEAIIDELTKIPTEEKGESIQITFTEGITLIEAAQILQDEGVCDSQDFIFYFNSGGFGFEFEDQLPLDSTMKFERMEGYLFPDTYYFFKNSSPEEVCQKIYYNFNQKMTPERYQKMKECNLSLDQLVTFASIVQAEAPTKEEMIKVASVFWNRLEHSDEYPKLESDPTSNYANDVVRPNMEYFDEAFVSAYDTYKTTGLPSGAICNPGIDAIDAVLKHEPSEYYFFVANIYTKETYYSVTNEEHDEKVAMVNQQYAEMAAAEEE